MPNLTVLHYSQGLLPSFVHARHFVHSYCDLRLPLTGPLCSRAVGTTAVRGHMASRALTTFSHDPWIPTFEKEFVRNYPYRRATVGPSSYPFHSPPLTAAVSRVSLSHQLTHFQNKLNGGPVPAAMDKGLFCPRRTAIDGHASGCCNCRHGLHPSRVYCGEARSHWYWQQYSSGEYHPLRYSVLRRTTKAPPSKLQLPRSLTNTLHSARALDDDTSMSQHPLSISMSHAPASHSRRRDSCDRPLTAARTLTPTLCPFAPRCIQTAF